MLADHFDHGFAVEWMRKIWASASRKLSATARASRHRAGGPVLRRGGGDGRQALGYVQSPSRARKNIAGGNGVSEAGRARPYLSRRPAQCAARRRARRFSKRGPLTDLSLRAGRNGAPVSAMRALSPFSQPRIPAGGACDRRLRRTARRDRRRVLAEGSRGATASPVSARPICVFVAKRPALARLMFGPPASQPRPVRGTGRIRRLRGQRDRRRPARSRAGTGGVGGGTRPCDVDPGERSSIWASAAPGSTYCRRARRSCCAACFTIERG